jgi:hypothetical protein
MTKTTPDNEPMSVAVILDDEIGHSVCPADETDENCKLAKATTLINALIAEEKLQMLDRIREASKWGTPEANEPEYFTREAIKAEEQLLQKGEK